jgi:MerR family mercuric resistance operon transcriptional regulator
MNHMKIGQVAKDAGVGVETIRFYEREGLLEEPPRRPSGYRQYPSEAVVRISFIRAAKELGFSLAEIRELLALRVEPDARCADVKERATHKIVDIEQKIRTLQRMKRVLKKLTAACDEGRPTSECPILAALDAEAQK